MKDKLILNEDLELELPSYENQDIRDLYEEQGIDLFNEDNIPFLKAAGLLDEAGYPVETYEDWRGETRKRPMTLYDLFSIDEGMIESPYIRQLALDELYADAKVNDIDEIKVNYTDKDLPQIRDISKDFLEGCFSGEVWDYFMDYGDYSFRDCKYALDDIPNEVLDILESKGFPRDIYKQLMNDEADEDSYLSEWYDSLKDALVIAYQRGEEDGSAIAAENDFNEAFRNSMPDGVTWVEQESTESVRPLVVSKDFVENSLEGIWGYLDTYSEDMYSSFVEYLKQTINDNITDNFREPYYGWQAFDREAFGDRLLDEIMQLDIQDTQTVDIEFNSNEEKDLLNFDGETGEYHEDLELGTDIQLEKPKKLFYKYKEYNKEISSKAYRLDNVRLSELLEFLHSTPHVNRYVSEWDLKDLEEYAISSEDSQYVILSSIKPSYKSTYGQNGYTIWIDNGDYDLNYIGWIPKEVGNSILHNITEDLELNVDLIPDIDVDSNYYFDGIEDLILGKMNEEIWGVYVINWSSEDIDYEISAVILKDALARYKELCKQGCEPNETIVLYVYDDNSGDDIPVKSFDSDDRLTEEQALPDYTYYECYMERKDSTSWNPETYDWDGEPSNENQSIIIKVHDSEPEPTPAEAESFLEDIGVLPDGYTVLYLSEMDSDNEWVEDSDEIYEILPKVDSVDLNTK